MNAEVTLIKDEEIPDEYKKTLQNNELSVNSIPDIAELTRYVYEILIYLENPDTKKAIERDESAVRMLLCKKYADTRLPFGIISLLMEEDNRVENVNRMLTMFDRLLKAKKGEISLEDVEKKTIDEVNDRYLYSAYGSKEAFEEKLKKEVAANKKKTKNNENKIEKKTGKKIGKSNIKK